MLWITGASGQLGSALKPLFQDALFTTRDSVDITDEEAVKDFVEKHNITMVINCAAYTQVDKAETETELAYRVNTLATACLAKACRRILTVSTDYVFDGTAYKPYVPSDSTNPLGVYGKTKLAGEVAVMSYAMSAIIIRTSWLYAFKGVNFVNTIYKLAQERETLDVVCDQIGSPTYVEDLALAVAQIVPQMQEKKKEIYHYANAGVASWYDIACEIVQYFQFPCKVRPILSHQYKTQARRPHYSVLDTTRLQEDFSLEIPWWKHSLYKCLAKYEKI